jgi:antitoxin ParD1/3/4
MPNIEISLSESAQAYVEQQVASRGYSSISAYVEELVRRDQADKNFKSLKDLLEESLDSGVATPMTVQDWGAIRYALRESTTQGQNPPNA